MISHLHRCIYVHIPKTAGNSVNRVFGIGWEDHKDLQRYAAETTPELFSSYYKFAIVRNPWDRLFSDYNYQLKKSRSDKLYLHDPQGVRRTFAQWVRAALADPYQCAPATWGGDVSPGLHRWSPQLDWVTVHGRNALDFVVRLEHMEQDFGVVCDALKLPRVRLPRRNRRFHLHYSWYYDDLTRDLVGAYYARDIAAFGYQFESSPACSVWRRSREFTLSALNALRIPPALNTMRTR